MSPKKSKLSKKVSGRKTKSSKRLVPHYQWEFKPKLENEAIVLHSILSIYDIPYYKEIVDDIRGLITKLVQNHGFHDGSDRYKIIKDYTLALVEDRKPSNPEWLATSEVNKVPSQLGENFCQLLSNYFEVKEVSMKSQYYQVINTILNIVRMVDGLVEPELSSITDKAITIDQDLLTQFETHVSKRMEKVRKPEISPNLFNFRFNLKKNGPNGLPKIESSIEEAKELLNSKLARPFRIICEELHASYLYEYLVNLIDFENQNQSEPDDSNTNSGTKTTTRLRVLANVPDHGFKTRTVAIVDFWSQLILEPLRSLVQSMIEIEFGKTDFRKDQDLGVAQMEDLIEQCLRGDVIEYDGETIKLDIKYLKSYDISSWTERFHRDLQKIVMRNLTSPRLAEAWAQLTVHCDWYHVASGLTIKYGQGQAMGTNGSFDIATLTDHYFIDFIINEAIYGKVGDDLWILDPKDKIPDAYRKINLPINISKSKGSSAGHSYMEFCSRTFLDSNDVSRISPRIISKSKDFRFIPALLGLCSSRGIQIDASSFETLNRKIKGKEETYFDKLQGWILTYLMLRETEQSSTFQSLTIEYLEAGNWISQELKELLKDPALLYRLLIAYSIISIQENKEAVEDLLFDLVDAMDDMSDEITQLTDEDANLFDISNPYYATALESLKVTYLTPKQIIVLGRYVDQRRLLQVDLIEINDKVASATSPSDVYEYSRQLSKIANKSCYDQGNINYDVDRVYTRQYRMVKVLDRMDKNFTTLSGLEAHQLRSIWQTIPLDEIDQQWEGIVPTL